MVCSGMSIFNPLPIQLDSLLSSSSTPPPFRPTPFRRRSLPETQASFTFRHQLPVSENPPSQQETVVYKVITMTTGSDKAAKCLCYLFFFYYYYCVGVFLYDCKTMIFFLWANDAILVRTDKTERQIDTSD